MTGIGPGGNKVRSLEYILGEAKAKGATKILAAGPEQSNLCVLTAASCARAGLECELVINSNEPERKEGNLLLEQLLGTKTHYLGPCDGETRNHRMEEIAAAYREEGELQGPNAALPFRGVQDSNPDSAGQLCPSLPQLSAMQADHPFRGDDTGDIRTVVWHNGLRCLLLGQCGFRPGVITIIAGCFQFQFHVLPILSRHFCSAATVCGTGTGYAWGTLNSLRRIPRRNWGERHTTMFIHCLLSPPTAGAAARDQQEGHQKQQRSYRENGRDEDPGSQRHSAYTQDPAAASSATKHPTHAPFSLPAYTPGLSGVQKTAGHFDPAVDAYFFFSCQSCRGLSSSKSLT